MRTFRLIAISLTVLATGVLFAGKNTSTENQVAVSVVYQAKKSVALHISDLLKEDGFRELLATRLETQDRASMNELLHAYRGAAGANVEAVEAILNADRDVVRYKGIQKYTQGLMEIRVFRPEGMALDLDNVLVAFEPMGDDKNYTVVEAFVRDGNIHTLDAWTKPQFPVLVADINASEDLSAGIALLNDGLIAAGMQTPVNLPAPAVREKAAFSCTNGVATAKISNIRVSDDQEPWIKGKAEMYAFVSGIDPAVADPEIRVVDLPYLDHEDTTYYPNQILIYWYNYRYQAVNVNFYEHDDGTNYQEVLSAVLTGVRTILGVFAPEYAIIAEVVNAILNAMPGSWFTDDDDYVGVIYTIDRDDLYDTSGRTYYGASNNVRTLLVPYCLD